MTDQEIVAQIRRFGFSLIVYRNRVEVEEMGAFALKKHTVVPIRNIASVEKSRTKAKLVIRTNDGKRYEWVTAPETDRVYEALMAAL